MISKTSAQFDSAITQCKDIFIKKMKDYGSAWRILRTSSITDQIFIKAQRIRSIEDKGTQKIDESVKSEYIGIVNYAVIALMQLQLDDSSKMEVTVEDAEKNFNRHVQEAKVLMGDKNHDYDEAWRKMRVSSLTDLILMKLLRIKQIEDNEGKTLISEGIASSFYDIINYAIFALIRLEEDNHSFNN